VWRDHHLEFCRTGNAAGLTGAIAAQPDSGALSRVLEQVFTTPDGIESTVPCHVIDRAVLMANSGENLEASMRASSSARRC